MASSATRRVLTARRLAWRNRIWGVGSRRMGLTAFAVLASALALLGLGHLAAPSLLVPPIATATPTGLEPKSAMVAGQSALESAFWLTLLVTAVSTFRVMELLFRREDIRALGVLPVPAAAMFADRVVAALLEVCILSLPIGLFFVPLTWHGHSRTALVCALMPTLGVLIAQGIGFGVQLFFGHGAFSSSSDAAADPSQAFLYAPGASLGIAAVATLLLKLGLGEVLRTGALTRAAQIGVGGALGIGALGFAVGWRYFTATGPGYIRMLAGFREADFMGFTVIIDQQTSSFDKQTLFERLVPPQARAIYRRHALQYPRRYGLGRALLWVLGGLLALALYSFSPGVFPAWAVGASVMAIVGLFANPWARISRAPLSTPRSEVLPVRRADEARANMAYALREVLGVVIPAAIAILGLRISAHGDVLDALLSAGLATLGGLALGAPSRRVMAHVGEGMRAGALVVSAVALTILVVAVSIAATPIVGLGVAGALTVTHLIEVFRGGEE